MPLDTLFAYPTRPTGILSRLTAPLAARNRNVTEFYIDVNDPWKAYSPEETVLGCVVLTVSKPLAITHLVVCLHGHARVYKNQVVPGDGSATSGFLGPGRGSRGTEYLGNGFASLFEDEKVLCGQGLLRKGIYQFKFEVAFPRRGLPSSLDFERGTVSYFLTATLTRPTTIAPTLSCDRRLFVQDAIDVGYVPVPKPRVISLQPINKRGKMKAKMKQRSLDNAPVPELPSADGPTPADTTQTESCNRSSENRRPPSPVSSDQSYTSAVTTSSQSFQIVHHSPSTSGTNGGTGETTSTVTSHAGRAISASIQLLRPGVLPGDVVPLRITVNHQMPNVRGLVIGTLYRQGSVDMHPAIPLISKAKGNGKQPEYEDVYPRSKTGLGGLHFSSSAPSSVFRKDLSQTSAMMVVDPQTLTADVKTSLRIPEDVFPTMVNVPGDMIQFKYYVEVIIDLCGQLAESRFLPRISLTSPMQTFTTNHGSESGLQLTSRWTDNILDTAQLRRGKNVVVALFEIIVGSKDSTRGSKKWGDGVNQERQRPSDMPDNDHTWVENQYPCDGEDRNENNDHDESNDDAEQRWATHAPGSRLEPSLDFQEDVDEKTKLRRQEALLLPSQPPRDEASSSSAAQPIAPSAPFIAGEEGFDVVRAIPGGGVQSPSTMSETSIRSTETIIPLYSQTSLPRLTSHEHYTTTDDKQEMERQRLMAETSAPPPAGSKNPQSNESSAGTVPGDANVPSAPILTVDDEYNAHTLRRDDGDDVGDEDLPRYQR